MEVKRGEKTKKMWGLNPEPRAFLLFKSPRPPDTQSHNCGSRTTGSLTPELREAKESQYGSNL